MRHSGRPPSHSARAHNPPDGASVGHAAIGGQGSASERVSASEQTDASVEEVPLSGDDTPESEGLPAYPTTAADAERKAWSMVESLDWEEILQRCPMTAVSVRDYLKPLWLQALRLPLRCLSVNVSDIGAWKLLFLLPSMLLSRANRQRGGKYGKGEIRSKFRQFLDFAWEPLLKCPMSPRSPAPDRSNCRSRLRKADHHVRDGALSRAAHFLTCSGLAPASEDTLHKLESKRPAPFRSCNISLPSDTAVLSLEH